MTNLEVLELDKTLVSDIGLSYIQGLINLVELNLNDNNITDQGLSYLKKLPKLWQLNLTDTKVTEDGVKDLVKALPNIRISGLRFRLPYPNVVTPFEASLRNH